MVRAPSRYGATHGNQVRRLPKALGGNPPAMAAHVTVRAFRGVVAIVLSLVIAVVVALARAQLLIRVVPLLVSGAVDPLDQ